MDSLPSGIVTFLFTDIEGSTALAQQHPAELLRGGLPADVTLRDLRGFG